MPKHISDQSGNFFASSAPSQSFTPVQRAHTAVVGCSVFGFSHPSCRANTAATPDASTNQRAETLRGPGIGCSRLELGTWDLELGCCEFPSGIFTSTTCFPPEF